LNKKKILKDSVWISNPIAFQVLGVCSALAVTVKLEDSLVMGFSLTLVVAMSNFLLSSIRSLIPTRIRIIVELAVISSLVNIIDELLLAYYFEMSKALSVFVSLIITNCIVMGRAEAFALANNPVSSFFDGIGNGLGYALVLSIIGALREFFGSGSLLGIKVIPDYIYSIGYVDNGLMLIPPAAFILLGLVIWTFKILGGAQGENK
jgi:Na+-transporting NADH:ubiquinone oxidoreductase subunit D